jgi:hypothetical protein
VRNRWLDLLLGDGQPVDVEPEPSCRVLDVSRTFGPASLELSVDGLGEKAQRGHGQVAEGLLGCGRSIHSHHPFVVEEPL